MDPSVDISPSIALASILSGIFLVSFIMLLLHLRLLRRSRARQSPPHNATNHDRDQDHEADLASETEKRRRGPTGFSAVRIPPSSRASLNLEPNQPIFVDVVVVEESADADGRDGSGGGSGGPRAGLQFILTPPTPGK